MTSLLPSQRAAEDFEKVLAGTASPAVAERYAGLVETVEALRAQPDVVPRAEFVDDLRSRLMTAAETDMVAAPPARRTEPSRPGAGRRRAGTLAAALVIVGGTAGMAAAAQGAMPGESLYPIKRGIEKAGVALRIDDAAKGQALLDQASTRLEEVQTLQAQDSPDPDLVASTLESFNEAADSGSDYLFSAYQADGAPEDITAVRDFTSSSMPQVVAITEGAAAAADELLRDAADTLADIDQQARVLCGGCSPADAVAPPGALASGAGAFTVSNLLTRPVAQARTDIAAAQAARIAKLQALAQKSAGELTRAERREALANAGSGSTTPVTSTLTRDGKLVPTAVAQGSTAVKGLVAGVTGTVTSITKPLDDVLGTATGTKKPLEPVVKGLEDTVNGLTGELLP